MFNIGSLVSSVRRIGSLILTKAQEVAALNPVFWGDSLEAYAKSKFAVYITSTSGDLLESTDTSFNKSETDAFSINCWVKFDNLSGIKVLISNLDFGTVEGYEVFHTADNKVRWIITKNGSDRLYVEGSTTLANNTWYNIAVSYDGTNTIGGLNIFINGVGESLTTITNSPPSGINCPSQFRIGCTQGTLEPDFNVDQVTFFNKALSSSEITALYNSGNGVHHKDLVGTESYYSSIAAWYDFNTIQNFGRDYHGESHAVSVVSGTDYLSKTNPSDFNFNYNDPWSVAGWIKFNTGSSDGGKFAGKYNNSTTSGWILFSGDRGGSRVLEARFGASTSNRIFVHGSTDMLDNTWYHIGLSYDGTGLGSGFTFYINGVAESLTTLVDNLSSNSTTTTEDFAIAGLESVYSGSDMTLDEMAIYSDELTSGEFTTLYNGGIVAPARTLHTDNLVSDYSFNEQNLELIGRDSHGSNNLTPVSITESDLVGGVKDARIQYFKSGYLTNSSILNSFSESTPFSISGWVDSTVAGIRVLVSKYGTEGFAIQRDNSLQGFRIFIADGSGNKIDAKTTTVPTGIISWAFSYDGLNNGLSSVKFYINGIEETLIDIATTGTLSGLSTAIPFSVSGYNNGSGLWSDGGIYSVAVFDDVITRNGSTGEVDVIHAIGKDAIYSDYTGSTANLVAWYDFENSADLGKDSHGTNHLTVNGSPTVGPARETSLDLTEVSIDSSNAALGHIEGAAAGSDEVTKWTDRSASGFDVVQTTIADAATYVENGFGSKGSFKDGELDLDPEPFNFTGDFAIGCWFKQDELTQFRFPIGVWGSTGSRSFGIRIGSSGAGIQFAVSHDGSTQSNTAITDKPIVAGEWYFGFGWHENGVQIGFRMWDIGGNEIGVEQLDPHTTGVFNSTSPFRIGGHTNEWNGELGDVYVFDKLLTSQEQQKLIDYSRESAGYAV